MGMSQAAHSTPQKTPGLQRPLPLRRGRRHTIDTRLELGQALCFFWDNCGYDNYQLWI